MWICFNTGFISVVEDKRSINELVVRARRKDILEKLFPNNEIVQLDPKIADYKYRIYCSKLEMANIIADNISNIDYSNFKNSVNDYDTHELYADMWNLHYSYQK